MEEALTYEEKIETILSILATPIWRRRLKDDMLNKLITEAYFETKEPKIEYYERIREILSRTI